MWVVLNWFRSSRNEGQYPGTVDTEHVEITGGSREAAGLGGNHWQHIEWRGDVARNCKELFRKTQAGDWEGSGGITYLLHEAESFLRS
jgi:hypothetical protein